MHWKGSKMLSWILLGCISLASGRKGFENPMIDAGTLTFIAMDKDDMHHLPNPVHIRGVVPAASIIARAPSLPPVDFLDDDPYMPPSKTNFSVYLTNDKQFDVCFFLNLNIPSYPEAPDFRAKRGNSVVVENSDFKRMARKVEEQRQRLAEGELPTLEELQELPQGFYPLKDLSERCIRSSPLGQGHVVSCDVQVDYPLRMFGSMIPLLDLTVVSDSNRANVTEIVEQMKTSMERGIEMVRKFGPPVPQAPPMMPPFAQPPPPPPPHAAGATPFAGFPGIPRPETNDNGGNNNRNGRQTPTTQNNQWRPYNSQNRQTGNQWIQGAPGNMPMRAYRGQ